MTDSRNLYSEQSTVECDCGNKIPVPDLTPAIRRCWRCGLLWKKDADGMGLAR